MLSNLACKCTGHNSTLNLSQWGSGYSRVLQKRASFPTQGLYLGEFCGFFIFFFSGNTRCSGAGWSSYTAQIMYQRVQTQPCYTRNVIPGIPAAQKCRTLCSALISWCKLSMASPPSLAWNVHMLCTYRANWRGEDVCPALVCGQPVCLMFPGRGLDPGKLAFP